MSAAELKRLLDGGEPLTILDIRDREDLAAGRLPGSKHLPLEKLMARVEEIPKGPRVVVTDLHGLQSLNAGRYLVKQGYSRVSRLEGGLSAWAEAKLPLEK